MSVVATSNLRFTMTDAAFEHGLRLVLAEHPDTVALQEVGPNRDHILDRVGRELGYSWARPKGGGEPVMWETARYRLRSCTGIRLAGAEWVGHLPGRKDRLPASICTEVVLEDIDRLADGLRRDIVTVVEDYHLTAEVQYGTDYRKDLKHRLRVLRHKREKRRLGRRGRMQRRRGRTVRAAGDGNFAGMQLGGFVNCWTDRSGGDLGGRPVSIIFADRKPPRLWTLKTGSDHLTVFVDYP